jgi:hypothetical protein
MRLLIPTIGPLERPGVEALNVPEFGAAFIMHPRQQSVRTAGLHKHWTMLVGNPLSETSMGEARDCHRFQRTNKEIVSDVFPAKDKRRLNIHSWRCHGCCRAESRNAAFRRKQLIAKRQTPTRFLTPSPTSTQYPVLPQLTVAHLDA